ncbi:MAG: cupredoxin domain-containing protein [Thaumarchaeota archaeon]|nr:cupredoxin domain-containing protein [Nitrososphaerota archaeon]
MAQKQQGSVAVGVTIAVTLILVLASIGYYQYIYAPSIPTSNTATTTTPSNLKTVIVNITLNSVSACGGPSGTDSSLPSTCDAYSPNPTRLVAGVNNSVIFDNVDTAVHTATAFDNSFDTGILNGGEESNSMVIEKLGENTYFCAVHPWMKGELIVLPASGTTGVETTTTTATATDNQEVTSPAATSTTSGVVVSIIKGSGIDQSSPGYSPAAINVVIGVNSTITWSNDDTSPHTVTDRNGAFDSANMNTGATFTFTFTTAGTYDYYCVYHPWMKGTVVVKG